MDKYLLFSMPLSITKNVGDYVQILAARQFYNKIDGYLEKEELSKFQAEDGDKVKAIMNGWFLWKPENWPPSDDIEPLFVSIHFSPLIIKDILIKKDYLIKHSPIGCRDIGTMEALKKEGIDCYFSGCLTLTLGNTYRFSGKRKGICFVDPYIPIPSKSELKTSLLFRITLCFVRHANIIMHLQKKDFFKYYSKIWGYEPYIPSLKGHLKCLYKATVFYFTYHSKFTDRVIASANYINHIIPVDKTNPQTSEDWLNMADKLLKQYMTAELVITSRIHAALPCLAMETPIIFMTSEQLNSKKIEFNTPGRLEGLIDFFRTMKVHNFTIKTSDDKLQTFNKIDINTSFRNKDNWREYAKRMIDLCQNFMN